MTDYATKVRGQIARLREIFDPSKEPTDADQTETVSASPRSSVTIPIDLRRLADAAEKRSGG